MEPSTVSIRQTSLCLPFDNEAHYQDCVENLTMYRQHIEVIRGKHPERVGFRYDVAKKQ